MNTIKKQIATSLMTACIMVTSSAYAFHGSKLDQAISGEHRSASNKARDQYRHPKETLEFLRLEPHMTVVEITPGGGWYTGILAPG